MWNLPEVGIKLVSLALAGGLLTSEPPGNPSKTFLTLRVFDTYSACQCRLTTLHTLSNAGVAGGDHVRETSPQTQKDL